MVLLICFHLRLIAVLLQPNYRHLFDVVQIIWRNRPFKQISLQTLPLSGQSSSSLEFLKKDYLRKKQNIVHRAKQRLSLRFTRTWILFVNCPEINDAFRTPELAVGEVRASWRPLVGHRISHSEHLPGRLSDR